LIVGIIFVLTFLLFGIIFFGVAYAGKAEGRRSMENQGLGALVEPVLVDFKKINRWWEKD
jgi:hypothetical protein